MMRMAELDQRKELLSMKRRLLDETFGGTLARMEAMNPDKAREFMTRKLLEAAQGDETLAVSPRQAEIFDEAFVDQVNRLLSEKGVPGQLARRVDQSVSDGGLLLQRGGMTVDLTYRSILNRNSAFSGGPGGRNCSFIEQARKAGETMPQISHEFAIGRVRALEGTLLKQDVIEKLLTAQDAQEAFRMLWRRRAGEKFPAGRNWNRRRKIARRRPAPF